jgi:hypothetical protein
MEQDARGPSVSQFSSPGIDEFLFIPLFGLYEKPGGKST